MNKFTGDTTAQEVLDFLSSEGIDASDEEVHALKESLLLKDSNLLAVSDESLKEVVGGKEDQGIGRREIEQPNSDKRQSRGKCPRCCLIWRKNTLLGYEEIPDFPAQITGRNGAV